MTDEEFLAGEVQGTGDEAGAPADPCFFDDRTMQAAGLTYTTAPFTGPMDVAGPIAVTIRATSNRPQTEWIATLEKVSRDGSSQPLGTGALLGSLRRLQPSTSWYLDGKLIAPDHPYTAASESAVTPGAVTTYKLEIPGILAQIPTGDELRITINSSDTPYLLPSEPDLQLLVGGTYQVMVGGKDGSSVKIPFVAPSSLQTSTYDWGACVTDC
jgi:hypothetical protein